MWQRGFHFPHHPNRQLCRWQCSSAWGEPGPQIHSSRAAQLSKDEPEPSPRPRQPLHLALGWKISVLRVSQKLGFFLYYLPEKASTQHSLAALRIPPAVRFSRRHQSCLYYQDFLKHSTKLNRPFQPHYQEGRHKIFKISFLLILIQTTEHSCENWSLYRSALYRLLLKSTGTGFKLLHFLIQIYSQAQKNSHGLGKKEKCLSWQFSERWKRICCGLLLTHSAVSWDRGPHYALTTRQLRELPTGVCLSSKRYFSGQKLEKT